MEMWFLVIILVGSNVEQHIAVEMPSLETCKNVAKRYIHVAEYPTPTTLNIDDVRCEGAHK